MEGGKGMRAYKPEDELTIPNSIKSKGNQTKFYKDGRWYKKDQWGHEGLSEVLASWVAQHTNLPDFAPVVKYSVCTMQEPNPYGPSEHPLVYRGCYSPNFLTPGEECITLYRILTRDKERKILHHFSELNISEQIDFLVKEVTELTSLLNFGEWLTCILEFDMLIMNTDRHLNNLAVVRKSDGSYRLMDLFDSGSSLGSGFSSSYFGGMSANDCIRCAKAKPFSDIFIEQVQFCREKFGRQLKISIPSLDEVPKELNIYTKRELGRAKEILRLQIERF